MEKLDISVIIPTYNRPQQLSNCLQALIQIKYPSFEVIIVDDGSDQSLENTVFGFQSQLNIKLITQENQGPAAARNTGAKFSQAEYLAFTDDDCLPNATWLASLAEVLKLSPHCLVGGKTENALAANPYATTSQAILEVVYSYYYEQGKPLRFFASNNFAVSRLDFLNLGGFNENFRTSEDREFCDRWLTEGYDLKYVPSALLYHAHELTLATYWRQHFNYGRGAYKFYQRRMKQGLKGLKVEGQFYQKLITYPFSSNFPRQFYLKYWLILFTAQLANLLGFYQEKIHNFREN